MVSSGPVMLEYGCVSDSCSIADVIVCDFSSWSFQFMTVIRTMLLFYSLGLFALRFLFSSFMASYSQLH